MKKIKNLKITRKALALVAAGTLVLTFVGCSSNQTNLLEGTILENARVITFEDGHTDIATIKDSDSDHRHYRSIITNEYFSSKNCKNIHYNYMTLHKYDITSDESIIIYLTKEEIAKASKDELTEDDIANIISRIFDTEKEKTK